jgi:poly(hydroxyalkanoate) depolymerase family esterase
MARRIRRSAWAKAFERSFVALTRQAVGVGTRGVRRTVETSAQRRKPPAGEGDWIAGLAIGPQGARRYRLYRPPVVRPGERMPLLVMLHGCGQDAKSFAQVTRINRIAAREGFLVLYPEQDRLANAQGCWNWFDTGSGRAYREAELIMRSIDQVCQLYSADPARVAVAGLSAGASMAALLGTRHPGRFKAVVMHSGIPPGTADSAMAAVGAMRGRRATTPLPIAAKAVGAVWPPLMVIHGSGDRVVSARNGHAAVSAWSLAAGAKAGKGRNVQRGRRYPMQVTDYKLGTSTVATLVEVQQLGHAWSGGAANVRHGDQQGPDASQMLWTFVAKQFAA